jgi:hypothetical protein
MKCMSVCITLGRTAVWFACLIFLLELPCGLLLGVPQKLLQGDVMIVLTNVLSTTCDHVKPVPMLPTG